MDAAQEELAQERKHKHLDFIQLTITRMAANAFLVKGWAVSLTCALLALQPETTPLREGLLAVVPPVFFGFLDANYLMHERRYRRLYNDVASGKEGVPHYSLDTSRYTDECIQKALRSWSVVLFYPLLALAAAIVASN